MTSTHIAPNEYEEFRRFLEDACGIMLGDNKHYLVTSRLTRLMREFDITTFSELMVQLKQKHHTKLRERIVDAMTTNETMWFRDRYPFDILTNIILPEHSSLKSRQLRIWSAACSSGQEPYSISMLIQEYLASKPGALSANIQIVATDISPSVLKEASSAQYDKMSITRGIGEDRVKRFFSQKGERWEVKPEIRGRVSFREMNLMQSYAALGKFDIVFCRNVLIYFSSELKKDILTRIAQSMNPRGYLFLGGSESPTSYVDMFEMVRTAYGVVYRLKTGYR
ncbi:MAG: protein-glutamate O-methyltransferase CheR [Candidatus Zixiibacteriota bacterium]